MISLHVSPHRRSTPLRRGLLGIALVVTGLASCATYPERTAAAFRDFESGQLSQAQAAYANPNTTGAEFLTYAESGMVALSAGRWDDAITQLSKAADFSKEYEDQALLDPEALGETILSWTINESQTTYRGEGYERVMIHACLAMAYLGKGNFSDARVEVRRANGLLESEEKLYKKSYKAGGLGHFVSAMAYELERQGSDAYIDYSRMVEKDVGVDLAGRALVRLAKALARDEDLKQWEARFGADEERPKDAASVVVLAGVGIGPYKREITLPIPTGDGLLQWSVPYYEQRPQAVTDLQLSAAGGDREVRTVVIEDVGSVAVENLNDRIAWLAAKSAVRAFLKLELTKQLEKQAEGWGQLLGVLFTFISERADLRAWQTLPATWQAARVFLAPGRHDLILTANGGERVSLGQYELTPGETMFVFARTIGTRLFAHPVGGHRLDGAPAASPQDAPAAPASQP